MRNEFIVEPSEKLTLENIFIFIIMVFQINYF